MRAQQLGIVGVVWGLTACGAPAGAPGDTGGEGATRAAGAGADRARAPAPVLRGVQVNEGTGWARDRTLTLHLDVDPAGTPPTEVCVAPRRATCERWRPFAATLSYLDRTDGEGTGLTVWLRGAERRLSAPVTVRVRYDNVPPVSPALTVSGAVGGFSYSYRGASDAGAGLRRLALVARAGAAPPSCRLDQRLVADLALSGASAEGAGVVSGLAPGPYAGRVCLWDQAGNLSRDQTFTVTAAGETTPPTLTALRLDGGATTARDRELDVEIDATDATGIGRMCLVVDAGPGATCADWEPFAARFQRRVPAVDGPHTVSVWLEDGAGNRSPAPTVAAITLELPRDEDRDGHTDDVDCDDADRAVHPGVVEGCDLVDNDCDGDVDEGLIGRSADCPATDCAAIAFLDSSAGDGTYTLHAGQVPCDMTTDGGGWTRVATGVRLIGTDVSATGIDTLGLEFDELAVQHVSGSVVAGCRFPENLPGTNLLAWRRGDAAWQLDPRSCGSTCGFPFTRVADATVTRASRRVTVDMPLGGGALSIGTPEGVSRCTTGDNSGTALVDLWVRRAVTEVGLTRDLTPPVVSAVIIGDGSGVSHDRYVDVSATVVEPSGVARACVTDEVGACSPWVAWTGSARLRLPLEERAHDVYLWLEDAAGNRMAAPASGAVTLDLLADEDADGVLEDADCDDNNRRIWQWGTAGCPAVDSCATLLERWPEAPDGTYLLAHGAAACDMTTGGGGWTRLAEAAPIYGDRVDPTQYNSAEGIAWTELRLDWASGSVVAGCRYPEGLPSTPLTAKFGAAGWSSFGAACGSTCSTVFTPIPGADHQQADRSTYLRRAASTDPITLATIEGAAACTIGDNPGSAALEVWVR